MDTINQALENIPTKKEVEFTKDICMKFWREFCNRKITQPELQKEIAYIAIASEHGWYELERKPSPSKPDKLVNFLRISEELKKTSQFEKRFKLQEKIFQNIKIRDYISQLSKVQAENMKIFTWLKELKNIFEKEGDIPSKGKVQMRIEEFLSEGGEVNYNKLY